MKKSFEERIEAPNESIVSDIIDNSQTLVVAFAGHKSGLGMPPFEFFNMLSAFSTSKIFVRDLSLSWYLEGLGPKLKGPIEVTEHLTQLKKQNNFKKTLFLGNSMGGYAAILFGELVGADAVYAFAPQTFISPMLRLIHWDRRWKHEILSIHKNRQRHCPFLDLKKVLRKGDSKTIFHLFYCSKNRLDTVHARRLKGLPNVELHGYEYGGHGLIRSLRNNKELASIIAAAIENEHYKKTKEAT